MTVKKVNTDFSVADIMGLSQPVEVKQPEILIVGTAPVQTTVADENKDTTPATNNQSTTTPAKKERPKWLQWVVDHKAILICAGLALVLWAGFKKGVIDWK